MPYDIWHVTCVVECLRFLVLFKLKKKKFTASEVVELFNNSDGVFVLLVI